MRKLLVAATAFAFATIAEAGVYHYQKYLFCYDCHTMHASQGHGYTTGAVSTTGALYGNWLPNQDAPVHALLKGPVSDVCISCHNGQTFAPDVIDGVAAVQMPRSAGQFPPAGGGGHAIGGTTPPGGALPGAATSLQCTGCHIQHGSSSYRNLGSRSNANVTPTMAIATAASNFYNGSTDVFVALADSAAAYIPQLGGGFNDYYKMGSVRYQAITVGGVALTNRLNNFCAQCHANFHGAPEGVEVGGELASVAFAGETPVVWQPDGNVEFLRHPTAGVYVGQVSAHGHSTPPTFTTVLPGNTGTPGANSSFYNITNRVKFGRTNGAPAPFDVVSTSGTTAGNTTTYWTTDASANTLVGDRATPLCISCHNAHGSTKPFGLRFLLANGANADAENGSGTYRNLCGQCHGQGSKTAESYTGYSGTNP